MSGVLGTWLEDPGDVIMIFHLHLMGLWHVFVEYINHFSTIYLAPVILI
jgi:hypothetical protein